MDSPYGEVEAFKAPKDRKRGARKAKQQHSEVQIEREARAHKRETKKAAAKKPRKPQVVVDQSQVLVLGAGATGNSAAATGTGEPTIVRSFSLGLDAQS